MKKLRETAEVLAVVWTSIGLIGFLVLDGGWFQKATIIDGAITGATITIHSGVVLSLLGGFLAALVACGCLIAEGFRQGSQSREDGQTQ